MELCSQTYAQWTTTIHLIGQKKYLPLWQMAQETKVTPDLHHLLSFFCPISSSSLFFSIGSVLIQQFVCNMITFTLFNPSFSHLFKSSLLFNVTYGVYFCTDALCKKGYLWILCTRITKRSLFCHSRIKNCRRSLRTLTNFLLTHHQSVDIVLFHFRWMCR